MNCPKCGASVTPKGARYCPTCGEPLPAPDAGSVQVAAETNVGAVDGGRVAGVEIGAVGPVAGGVTIQSTVNEIEARVVQGDHVDSQTIINNVMVLGPNALDEIARRLADMQGVNRGVLAGGGPPAVPDHVRRQIAELTAAERAVTAQGLATTPAAAYHLGMLAAYQRDYEAALGYFRRATQGDPEHADAYEAIARLQQSRAHDDLRRQDFEAAAARLVEARAAVKHTDPLDPEALALRGYVATTLGQVAEARGEPQARDEQYAEAARLFEQAVQLDPANASALNGLGTVRSGLGDLDAAIEAYRRVVALAPDYAAAFHDLALACEAKARADPNRADEWRREALAAWRTAYALAPDDPGFSAEYVVWMGQRIRRLEQQG